ncbi:glycosyltransferase family 90 protein [Didymella exigua CBS 183.55]|uniref:Glycosyltransferase family 90 protein n=1 Tax=Didymella exigua CBS 183.55 TaxID=1150837 RepID=A0A6A5RIW5_9PLEO|nr:glycosyltransferase family 90 protein [Didymella exigua CBS 183.55]KAF1926396.1 glycosyltransferase family 90 protein [Didymella exigua CBS 183.55]
MDKKALFFPCGLILASSYLSTATPFEHSFALDKPLHTACLVLLLTGLLVVAAEAAPGRPHQPQLPARYVAIPLGDGHARPPAEQHWTDAGLVGRRKSWSLRAVGALLAVLLLALCGRTGLFYLTVRDVECTGPSPVAFLPVVLALYHSLRHPSQRQYPAWSADSRPKTLLERVVSFTYGNSTRYIVPSILLAISSFLVLIKTSALRSTYICPVSNSTAALVPTLQFAGFVLDTVIVQLLYRLVDDGISPVDDWTIQLQDGTSNNLLIGLTFIASSLVLVVAGIVVYPTMPEYREWMLSFPSEYLLGLLRLSLMIPFITVCFLKSARLYGVLSAVLTVAFSSAYIGVLRALGTGASHAFPPKSTVSLVLCLTLLTIALILYLVTDTNIESRIRSTVPVRLGRNQSATFVLILIGFSVGVVIYRRQEPILEHPVTFLIEQASVHHENWAAQAYRSQSLAQAVVNYQQRYKRDPPPYFDKWYQFAVARNSIVIDDYDSIEEDLALFSSYTPDDLRLRTATVLATHQQVGGVRIRDGSADALGNVPDESKWVVDGATSMIKQFAEFLPDMDLAFNLGDECRVAVPFERLQNALGNPQRYPVPEPSRARLDFSIDRADRWPHIDNIRSDPKFFEDARLNPSFQTYGSIACSPESRARKERHWNTRTFCPTCSLPHAMGAFVSNWTLATDPCHQPDVATLHGVYLSPTNLTGTHDIVPIFSASRAAGFVDIRYPSPWNYLGKSKYEFDEKYPDPPFQQKEDVLFWRGVTEEGVSTAGSWKGMLRQRLVHYLNFNTTSRLPMFLPKGDHSDKLEYIMKRRSDVKRLLETKIDAQFTELNHCAGQDCVDQSHEFKPIDAVDLRHHWRYRYLFDADGAGSSHHFLPLLQSNSVILKSGIFREWYSDRLVAWKHFVPVDLRLHDLFSILAYFGGYGVEERNKRMMEGRVKEAEAIARQGKVWSEKALRKEDMEVYMFRLLLEWGRLTDDKRTEIGFRLGRGSQG